MRLSDKAMELLENANLAKEAYLTASLDDVGEANKLKHEWTRAMMIALAWIEMDIDTTEEAA